MQGNKSTTKLKKYMVENNQNFPEINDYHKAKAGFKGNCHFKLVEIIIGIQINKIQIPIIKGGDTEKIRFSPRMKLEPMIIQETF